MLSCIWPMLFFPVVHLLMLMAIMIGLTSMTSALPVDLQALLPVALSVVALHASMLFTRGYMMYKTLTIDVMSAAVLLDNLCALYLRSKKIANSGHASYSAQLLITAYEITENALNEVNNVRS